MLYSVGQRRREMGIRLAMGAQRDQVTVTVTDARTYGAVCLLLGATVLAASWIPARRASRTDLVETLKTE